MSDIGCTFNWGSLMYESHVPTSPNIVKVVTTSGTSPKPSGFFDTEDKSYDIMQNLCIRHSHTSPLDEHDAKIKFMAELGLYTTDSKSDLLTTGEQCAESQSNAGTAQPTSSAGGSGKPTNPREAKKSGVAGWTYNENKANGLALDDFEDDGGKHVSSKLKVRTTKEQSKHCRNVKKAVPKGLTQPKIPFNRQPHLYPVSQDYGIDEILDKRVSDVGIEEYFIKWEGYSSDYNSWEPRQNVSESAVLDYEKTRLQKRGKKNINSPAILNTPENKFDPKISWKPKVNVAAAADLTLKPTDQIVCNTYAIDSKKSAPTEFVQKLIYDLNPEVALNNREPKNLETETNLEPMDEHFQHSSFGSNDSSGTASSSGSVVDISASAESNNVHGSANNGPSHPKRPKRIIPQKLSPVPKPVPPKRKKLTVLENNIRKGWDGKYLVEAIRDTRLEVDGTKSYLIKWVGFSSEENTWEPTENLTPEMIAHYEKKMAEKENFQAKAADNVTELKSLDSQTHETQNGKTTTWDGVVPPGPCVGSGPAFLTIPSGLTGRNSSSEHFDDEGYAILRTETNLAGRRVQTILDGTLYRNKIYFMVGFEGQDDCYTLVKGDDMNLVFPQEVLRFYENRISWSAMTD